MPFIDVKTNMTVTAEQETEIKTRLGEAITLLPGKSEEWLMVGIAPEYRLYFRGDKAPAAMVEISTFGQSPSKALTALTGAVCRIFAEVLDMDPERIYVKYAAISDWGWNGANF